MAGNDSKRPTVNMRKHKRSLPKSPLHRSADHEELERFVSRLFQPGRSTAARAYTAYFIAAYRDDIEGYIQGRISLSGGNYSAHVWAKKVRKLLRRQRHGPKGYVYNARNGTLDSLYSAPSRSFRLETRNRRSLTFEADHQFAVVVGYVVACVSIGVVLWLGWTVKVALEKFGANWVLSIEALLDE